MGGGPIGTLLRGKGGWKGSGGGGWRVDEERVVVEVEVGGAGLAGGWKWLRCIVVKAAQVLQRRPVAQLVLVLERGRGSVKPSGCGWSSCITWGVGDYRLCPIAIVYFYDVYGFSPRASICVRPPPCD